jgi:hypothetical protein
LVGSWFCSCVTSSCRKVLCRPAPVVLDAVLDVELVAEFVPFMVSSNCWDIVVPLLPIVVELVKEVLLRFRS